MNRTLVLFALLGCAAVAMAGSYEQDSFLFTQFEAFHGRQYRIDEREMRFEIFRENLKYIEAHNEKYNRGESTYHMGLTKFADMTNAEYRRTVLGSYDSQFPHTSSVRGSVHKNSMSDLPDSVDWRQKGVVTGVKDQGQCGSCWSFSATGSMEGAHALASGNLVSLSEQQLVDCVNGGANTCQTGGLMDQGFEYAIKNGMESEQEYPYHANSGNPCAYSSSKVVARFSSYNDVTSGSEADLQDAVANRPTVSVAIDASHMSFQFYSGGVYNEPACGNGRYDLDHGVLAVGYGSLNGDDYWIVKNSWGSSWGLSGYILMSRNKSNQCGIATMASYVLSA